MAYKLIAVDIDGTLLNSESQLTERNRAAILRAVDKGVVFTVSTGRPMCGVESINRLFSVDLPFITFNGAEVVMGKSGRKLFEQTLSPEDAGEIIAEGQRCGMTMMIWSGGMLFIEAVNDKTEDYKKISGVEPAVVEDFEDLIQRGITKILWYDDITKIQRYQSELGARFAGRVNCHASRPMFLEFVDCKASKAIAMEKLGQHYGIRPSEMIAVGDGFNDLSMIEYAGLGVAMANAPQAVKDRADFITRSNDEDGVAHVIDQFIFDR